MHNANELADLLEESIRLELGVAELYARYADFFPDDQAFWWQLTMEEKNHASLLKSARLFLKVHRFPQGLLLEDTKTLQLVSYRLGKRIEEFSAKPPGREFAYCYAYCLESSAAELHLQDIIAFGGDHAANPLKIFKHLGQDDCDHAERISGLIERYGYNCLCQ